LEPFKSVTPFSYVCRNSSTFAELKFFSEDVCVWYAVHPSCIHVCEQTFCVVE
jgi:hypothetical protein